MKKLIGKFIANIRRKRLIAHIEREIYHKIFPHLNGHADHGYPFSSDEGLFKARLEGFVSARNTLHRIDEAARKMAKAESNAFRYIVARDLNERLAFYLKYAQDRDYTPKDEPCLVAQAA